MYFKEFYVRFTEGLSHTGLQSIGSGARKHFVDSEYVPRVGSHSDMVTIFSDEFNHVFVGGNSGCFKTFGGYLFFF